MLHDPKEVEGLVEFSDDDSSELVPIVSELVPTVSELVPIVDVDDLVLDSVVVGLVNGGEVSEVLELNVGVDVEFVVAVVMVVVFEISSDSIFTSGPSSEVSQISLEHLSTEMMVPG